MKSPKSLNSALNHTAQTPRHSSLLLWSVLILVMLSGLLYLGSKVKQQRIVPPSEHSNHPSQNLPEMTNAHPQQNVPPTFEDILETLKSQRLFNPVVYKTSMILNDAATIDLNQNHDALWQQGQQKLTLIKATVRAGVDLSELTAQSLSRKFPVTLHLPPAHITQIQIDNVTMYDVKTGQPSTVQLGLSLTREQEESIKAQIEREFCQSEMLHTATEDTRQHVISLLDVMKASMIVRVAEPVGCQQAAS